jgi:hypothetical protein
VPAAAPLSESLGIESLGIESAGIESPGTESPGAATRAANLPDACRGAFRTGAQRVDDCPTHARTADDQLADDRMARDRPAGGQAGRGTACPAAAGPGADHRAPGRRRARAAACRNYDHAGRRPSWPTWPPLLGDRAAPRRCDARARPRAAGPPSAPLASWWARDPARRPRSCLASAALRPAARCVARLGRCPGDRVDEILPWHRDGLRRPEAQGFSPRRATAWHRRTCIAREALAPRRDLAYYRATSSISRRRRPAADRYPRRQPTLAIVNRAAPVLFMLTRPVGNLT